MTTARRRLQKDAVDSFSNCTRLFLVVMTPMPYSLPAGGMGGGGEEG